GGFLMIQRCECMPIVAISLSSVSLISLADRRIASLVSASEINMAASMIKIKLTPRYAMSSLVGGSLPTKKRRNPTMPIISAISAVIMTRRMLLASFALSFFLLGWAVCNAITRWPAPMSIVIVAMAIINVSLTVIVQWLQSEKHSD